MIYFSQLLKVEFPARFSSFVTLRKKWRNRYENVFNEVRLKENLQLITLLFKVRVSVLAIQIGETINYYPSILVKRTKITLIGLEAKLQYLKKMT